MLQTSADKPEPRAPKPEVTLPMGLAHGVEVFASTCSRLGSFWLAVFRLGFGFVST